MEFEAVIGLEVHAQLLTHSKIFCSCSVRFGATPNENTCPVCLGLPGALPVLNRKAVELAAMAALAFQCTVPVVSVFSRKNYFYPDLPKGYQISQFDQPLATNGRLIIESSAEVKTIRIKRIHLEEDAGKLIHEGLEGTENASLVDFNRSGVPLIEIVTEPDLRTSAEAYCYLTELKKILRYTGASLANMEEGNLRCDANISMRPRGSEELGTKVEIKNMNSFRNVVKALEFETERQTKALQLGKQIVQETRLFNANKGTTESMRSKEEAHDYRYFPEPDLFPLALPPDYLQRLEASLPELPEARRERVIKDYGLAAAEAEVLIEEKALADFFEETARLSKDPKQSANWILRDLLKNMNESGRSIDDIPVTASGIAELIGLIRAGTISGNQAKEVFDEMWKSGNSAEGIVRQKGMTQISDEEEIDRFIETVFAQNADLVQRYKNGEVKLLGVLVGELMKASKGKVNPAVANRRMREKLQ